MWPGWERPRLDRPTTAPRPLPSRLRLRILTGVARFCCLPLVEISVCGDAFQVFTDDTQSSFGGTGRFVSRDTARYQMAAVRWQVPLSEKSPTIPCASRGDGQCGYMVVWAFPVKLMAPIRMQAGSARYRNDSLRILMTVCADSGSASQAESLERHSAARDKL
jgi:hypothetical protein